MNSFYIFMSKFPAIFLFTIYLLQCQDTLDSKDSLLNSTEKLQRSESNQQARGSILPSFPSESDKLNFLQGKFQPTRYFTPYKNPGDDRQHYLLPDALRNYQAMVRAFEEEIRVTNPNYKQTIFIVSSFRDFQSQKNIWEGKFKGERKMRQSVQGKTPQEIVSLILEFSSAPGTSRHHWGTDIDLNSLNNSYFEKGGKGEVIYAWLQKNASRFGFCQPYNELVNRDGLGYNEEKWHWSYKPASSPFRKEWVEAYNSGKIPNSGFLGADALGELALTYVSSVNRDCY